MKLVEVEKEGTVLVRETGEFGIKNPVTISFTVDEKDYRNFETVVNAYRHAYYYVFSMLCLHAEEAVPFLNAAAARPKEDGVS